MTAADRQVRICVIGDIIGKPGRLAVIHALPDLRREHDLDLVIANGENTAAGAGLTPSLAEELLGGGIDVSYRFWDRFSLFAQYLVSDVSSRNFRTGDDGIDHLVRVELTRSFR